MAAVDYHGVMVSLKAILEADASLAGVPVFIEQEPAFDVIGAGKAIVIVFDGRQTPGDLQPMAAGKRTRFHARYGIWSVGFGQSYEEAAQNRDNLLGAVDLVLMNNRTVSGKLAHAWIDGGACVPVQNSQGLAALAETVLVGEATAIAT